MPAYASSESTEISSSPVKPLCLSWARDIRVTASNPPKARAALWPVVAVILANGADGWLAITIWGDTAPPKRAPVEGCPVVELHDSSADVESALMALYGDQEFINTDGVLCLTVVAAMIRLRREYEVPHLKEEGLRRLQRQFPSSLEDHGNLYTDAYEYIDFQVDDDDPRHKSAFSAINLAHECGIQTILPALYLETVGCDLEGMMFSSDELPIPYTALRSCVYGREKLLHAWMNRPYAAPPAIWEQPSGHGHPSWAEVSALSQGLCKHCQAEFAKVHEEERETHWAVLPSYFKLPAWDDLKDFEA
ncbi:hypothetical protein FA13DRAFT_1794778 [Coprinellus micaceus]|uniref:Uncharacterized protein n=1 Tax=Coprinellus micaceus TaxID=71717 RepID=A0A4Y7SZT8_COPMI|nr:hypothetical protein FA13DRAFT_1794778 [Coprinellus micaceus]